MTRPRLAVTRPVGPADGELVLLGPSLGTSSLVWSRCIPRLAERFRVAAWDLPGHGASPRAEGPFTVGDLADAVVDLADDLGAERFASAGVSVGGATGLELGLRHPDRIIAQAIVASGAVLGRQPSDWLDRASLVREQSTSVVLEQSAQRWFAPETPARDPDLTGRLLHVLQDADDESYARCCEAIAAFDVRERLGSITAPTLVLWGELDVAVPAERSAEIASAVPGAAISCILGAAHLPPADRPVETADALMAFFTEVAS